MTSEERVEVWCPHCEEHHDGYDEDDLHESIDEICRMKKHKREEKASFIEWLESEDHVFNVRSRRRNIDFRVGEIDIWPDTFDDDHLNTIGSSSVSLWTSAVPDIKNGTFIDDVVIHLPPARDDLRDDVDDALEIDGPFAHHFGTRALGGMSAPDGVITPHIQSTENISFDQLRTVVEAVLDVYEDVYEEGERAIQRKPG